MKKLIIVLLTLMSFSISAQEEFTLEKCYELVNTNYPLAKQNSLFNEQNKFAVEVIKKAKLPVLDFSAEATYQSDVTAVPDFNPNISIPSPNKDQYKVALSVSQLIYNGGRVELAVEAKNSELKTQQKQLEVSLYQLKKQVNQLYFPILLLQEKNELLQNKQSQLKSKLTEIKAGIKYGVILPSSDNILAAELLKVNQLIIEVNENRKSLITTLAQLTGKEIPLTTIFHSPEINTNIGGDLQRLELSLFQLKKQQITISEELVAKNNVPKLVGFATTGYGNPALNFLDNTFQSYYLVGIKLNWHVFDWNATKKHRMELAINKDIIDNQQEIFKLNTNIELQQQQTEMDKIRDFIKSDKTIIELRKKILKTADAQLKNGVITSSAYVTELTNLYEAENNLKTHQIQLLLAKANYKTTQGN